MSIAPQELWFERFEQIGSLIEKSAEQLTEQWARAIVRERRDADNSHYHEMRDRLPDLLRVMGRSLAHSENPIPAAHTMLALEHGEQRWQIGWRLTDVIHDYQTLRLVILEYLDTILEKPLRTREIMAIGLALDEAISASVLAYVGFQESQLREANRRLTDFLSVLGHELRNPLSAAVAALEVLRIGQARDDETSEAHQLIDRQLRQLTRLINDMSDVSRIIRGKLDLRRTTVDLRQIMQESIEALQDFITEREHQLSVELGNEPLWIAGDAARLRQIVMNLVHNAAKYTERCGQISIAVARRDDRTFLRIRDTGIGIPSHQLPHIFEMFSQGDSEQQQGLGVGLAVVRALVEMHDGIVSATSAGRGQGCEFVIEFPAVEEESLGSNAIMNSDEEAPSSQAVQPLRILLVDDHVDSAQTLGALLQRVGYQLCIAHDAPTAIEAVASFSPEVILVDIGLPGIDGYELARRLRNDPRSQHIPLVAITGYASQEARSKTAAAGFVAHLSKPVDLPQMQQLLATLVRK